MRNMGLPKFIEVGQWMFSPRDYTEHLHLTVRLHSLVSMSLVERRYFVKDPYPSELLQSRLRHSALELAGYMEKCAAEIRSWADLPAEIKQELIELEG